ncbi:MAG: hypothetical protein WC152_04305 [Candidatus Izemoplasmatales bacterium]
MKLDFKGIITTDTLKNDINNLEYIINENDYAIIVENGIGKYVVFDIDYVKNQIELKSELSKIKNYKKSPYTLVEAMIKTLEDVPEKKTTAIMLSSLILEYYGKKATPVIIRTRAEENANGKGEVDYFIIEPGNIIGLAQNSNYDMYMYNKFKREVELELIKLFRNTNSIELHTTISRIKVILTSLAFQKYTKAFTDKDVIDIILSLNKYRIMNNAITN